MVVSDLVYLAKLPSFTYLSIRKNGINWNQQLNASREVHQTTLKQLDLGNNHISNSDILNQIAGIFGGLTDLELEDNALKCFDFLQSIRGKLPHLRNIGVYNNDMDCEYAVFAKSILKALNINLFFGVN